MASSRTGLKVGAVCIGVVGANELLTRTSFSAILRADQTNKNTSWFVVAAHIDRGSISALPVQVPKSPPTELPAPVFDLCPELEHIMCT
jgi:hypothetical protein